MTSPQKIDPATNRLRQAGRVTRIRPAPSLVSVVLAALAALLSALPLLSADAVFYRAINLNGPALKIDSQAWEGSDAPRLNVTGNAFENQAVALKPATDRRRAQMLRSSRWGSKLDVELTEVPPGDYQVCLYVWEDNHSERFDLLVNEQTVLVGFHSGTAGSWKKLGPWPARSQEGKIKVSARAASHGAANLSGLEVWSGTGSLPTPARLTPITVLSSEQTEFFERRIRPLLVERCYECHSVTAEKIKGGLVLDSRAGLLQGGDSGPAITPGDPEASLLVSAVRHLSPDLTMPPKQRLSDEQIAELETWIRQGAPDPRTDDTRAAVRAKSAINWEQARQWWSFRPIVQPPPPSVGQIDWPANEIDQFILARLEQEGLHPAADTDRRTLLRRVTYDLTGLPSSLAEQDAFLQDSSPDAFAKVVDRLLASPRYGERWGRHWLDVVRYADSAGDNSDFPIPQLYRYRDWVIRAFNRDLPFDQFVREQLAGDLLPATTTEEANDRIIATGYLANARRFGSRVDDYPQHLTIEDTIDNLGRAFLGLTINCARCHDHKFDPISAADYYGLYGIFHSTRYPWPGIELEQRQRDLIPLVAADGRAAAEAVKLAHDTERQRLQKVVKTLKDSLKDTPELGKPAVEAKIREAEQTAQEFAKKPLPFDLAYAVTESNQIEDVPIQQKGDPAKPGEVVRRRFLTVLLGQEVPPEDPTSGRRLLAEWIVDRKNPLTARVMANRIWLYHFGQGLIPTPNDLGRQGKPPTHPELLDWLASRLMDSGGSVKSIHRVILLSHTYRLGGERTERARERDANNDLLSAFPRRRLDAEALRDTLLLLGNALDTSVSGPHPFPPQSEWKFTQHNPFKAVYDSPHRSVFLMTQRIQRHPYLAIFDGADPAASTPVRLSSTTPLQALYLLNDAFVHEHSQGFAARLRQEFTNDDERLNRAYQLALGRPAEIAELEQGRTFLASVQTKLKSGHVPPEQLEAEAWRALTRVIFRLNEFVYLD